MLTSRSNLALACALSGLAGYVDGIGFIHLGGLFVSFMSGNSTRLGVMIAEMNWWKTLEAVRLIAMFVVGAGLGSLIGRRRGRHRQWLLLLAEALLLGVGALAYELGAPNVTIAADRAGDGSGKRRVSGRRRHDGIGSYLHDRHAGAGRAIARSCDDGRTALGVAAEFAPVGGVGGRRCARHADLSASQSRRGVVCCSCGVDCLYGCWTCCAPQTCLIIKSPCMIFVLGTLPLEAKDG